MPRFTFTAKITGKAETSGTGDYPDYRTARGELAVFAGEMLRDVDGEFWRQRSWTIELAGEDGSYLCGLHIFAPETAGMITSEARQADDEAGQ